MLADGVDHGLVEGGVPVDAKEFGKQQVRRAIFTQQLHERQVRHILHGRECCPRLPGDQGVWKWRGDGRGRLVVERGESAGAQRGRRVGIILQLVESDSSATVNEQQAMP